MLNSSVLLIICTFLLCSHHVVCDTLVEKLDIVTQLDSLSLNTQDRLVCQKFTDIQPQEPLLQAADDFTLPLNISTNITIFSVQFAISRIRDTTEPDLLTIVLMYDEPSTQSPGQIFFTKSVRAPNNPPMWQNTSNNETATTEIISVNITNGEQSSTNNSVVFDLHDTVLLPRGKRLWLSFYVTGQRNEVIVNGTTRSESVLFWCISGPNTNSTVIDASSPYFYVDHADVLGLSLSRWQNASYVQMKLGLSLVTGSHNMAWSVSLLATQPSTFYEIVASYATKNIVIIVSCSIVALVILLCCALCVCRRCKRCCQLRHRYALHRKNTPDTIPIYELVIPQPHDNTVELENSIDGGGGTTPNTTALVNSLPSRTPVQRNPSSKFLENTSNIPVRISDPYKDK